MHTTHAPKKKTKGETRNINVAVPRLNLSGATLQMLAARSGRHIKRNSRTAERRNVRKEYGF